jgi:hypothetical protein
MRYTRPIRRPLRAVFALAFVLARGSAASSAGEPLSLAMICPDGFLPGIPVLVRLELRSSGGSLAREVWDAEAVIEADTHAPVFAPVRVRLFNGIGSALVTLAPDAGPAVTLTASVAGLEARRVLRSLAGEPASTVSGLIAGPLEEWSGVVHVNGPLTIAAGATLRLLPGTLVLVDGVLTAEGQPGACRSPAETPTRCGTSITVRGAVESLGSAERPVTFTARDPEQAWGEIHHDSAAPSFYEHTIITRAGNSRRGGHTNTGPALRASSSQVRFESCSIADTSGKTMQASGSSLEFFDCLFTRSVMGPEIDGTALLFDRSAILEMYGSDDNDGIYIHGQRAGQVVKLSRSIIAQGDDDGIDTLRSDVSIEDCIVRDYANPAEDSKGISVFGGEVRITRCLVAGNKVGITAKGQNGAGATVHVDRSTVLGNLLGIEAQDKFGEPDLRIRFFVTSSIVRAPDAVKTDYAHFPEDILIRYSNLSEPWAGLGNITDDPLFLDLEGHDYRLSPGSPCIDAGDPGAAPDPDGTRADMGFQPFDQGSAPRFIRGRLNDDPHIDLSDAVTLLLYLFGGGAIGCLGAADIDDDGAVSMTDAIRLLDHLFRGGPALPAPAGACGVDPTPDGLACAAPCS